MRVVLDTNVIVSGFLWYGAPRQLLDAARAERFRLFTSPALIAELLDVLPRSKFERRVAASQLTVPQLVSRYTDLTVMIDPPPVTPVTSGAEDDHVLACALAAQADMVVSGDVGLLSIGKYEGTPILRVATALELIDEKAEGS